jgi:undecaprenyl diphosphate synthase
MDGNGRWAKQRNQGRSEGHREGAKTAREVSECAARLGIKYLTMFTFSSENWKRSIKEVNMLMNLLYDNLVQEKELLMKNDIRLNVVGDIKKLPGKLQKKLTEIMTLSENNSRMQINLALNYGSRIEIVNAVKQIIEEGIVPSKINETLFSQYLLTKGCPDPDLLIRTSGELRISNFLLFQIAYSELYFTDILWPDFHNAEFLKAIVEFQHRDRRYGRA